MAFTEINTEDRLRLLRLIHKKTGDRRARPRAPLATQVQAVESFSLAFSRDLSLCGMFIETAKPPPVGAPLKVRFNLDDKNQVVITTARVHYQLRKMGMGILFDGLLPEHRRTIEEYIKDYQELLTAEAATGANVT